MSDHDLSEQGEYIIYGSQFPKYREKIRIGLRDGKLKCSVDYNRVGWNSDKPEDSIIYRVIVKESRGAEMLRKEKEKEPRESPEQSLYEDWAGIGK